MARKWLRRGVAGLLTATFNLVLVGPVFAQYPGGGQTPPPTVRGDRFFRGDDLGRTGFNWLTLVFIALAILVFGLALYALSRRASVDTTKSP